MATGPTDSPAFTTVSLDFDDEPVVVESVVDDTVPAIFYGDGTLANPDHARHPWRRRETPTTVTRVTTVQPRRRLDRRLGCGGRPQAKRTSSAGRGGPSELGDDDPPQRKPLEARYEWRRWAAERCEALDQLAAGGTAAHARDQLTLDIGMAA
jgi:hypothetical protein